MLFRDDLATAIVVAALLAGLGAFMLRHASKADRAVTRVTCGYGACGR